MDIENFLKREVAQALAKKILAEGGSVRLTPYIRKRMEQRSITALDIENVVRCGSIRQEGELENGAYRYRFETPRFCVVIEFASETQIVAVTTWRQKS